MKRFLPALLLALSLYSCGTSDDQQNKGAQADQDSPSNRDRDIDHGNDSAFIKENNHGPEPDSVSEAPNSEGGNPAQGIQGQSGTNQTGTDTTQ